MEYKVKGQITVISEKQMFDAGSGKLTFRIDTGETYNQFWEFELFKSKDYVEHLDNFYKYNKVGDEVEVEFNVKTNLWTNPKTNEERLFTSLSCWKVEKLSASPAPVETNYGGDDPVATNDSVDELPF